MSPKQVKVRLDAILKVMGPSVNIRSFGYCPLARLVRFYLDGSLYLKAVVRKDDKVELVWYANIEEFQPTRSMRANAFLAKYGPSHPVSFEDFGALCHWVNAEGWRYMGKKLCKVFIPRRDRVPPSRVRYY